MGRKKRKQARKLRTQPKQPTSEINKLARHWANLIAKLPPREHQNNKVLVDGKLGCIPFGQYAGYIYCKECRAKDYCTKEVKWIVTNGVFEAR